MMCDAVNRSFRAQLAAVLDKLTKAALLEIGNLADECSAVLHTEISQHRTENEALKKRCYSLEVQLRAAREAHGYPAHGNGGNRPHTAGQDDRKRGLGILFFFFFFFLSILRHQPPPITAMLTIECTLDSNHLNKIT